MSQTEERRIAIDLFDFAFIPSWYEQLYELSKMAQPEQWQYKEPETIIQNTKTPILEKYLNQIFRKQAIDYHMKAVRSAFQTVSYVPYLLSWSVVGSIWITLLSPSGLVNGLAQLFQGDGYRKIVFMSERSYARAIMIFTGAWKDSGYTAALFLAAIVSINPVLYEAASIDGATRMQQIRHILIPSIRPTVKVVVVLGMMGLLRNFDQIFVMANSSILDKVRNLLYLIYNEGIVQFRIGPASAAACIVLLATMAISFTVRRLIRYDQLS